ncbi:MAG: L,D-transpeptidase family protein [Nitrospiraceae bacterium]
MSLSITIRVSLSIAAMTWWLVAGLSACVQKAPPELLQAVEALDRELVEVQGAEFAPEEYARFVDRWVAVKGRLLAEEDVIHWPWETDPLVTDLHELEENGRRAAATAAQRKEARRLEAQTRLSVMEQRLRIFDGLIDEMGGRVVLGQRPIETEVRVSQARSLFEQGLYARSLRAVQEASRLLEDQSALLNAELGRYADASKVEMWRRMAQRTVEWSRAHRAAAIVVSKADRLLTLYRNGRRAVSYPVRLGFNGVLEKRYQGDGATPEGQYRVIKKRDRGQTQFYRALLLDYPNSEDRRRFHLARTAGAIPAESFIGGQIEIHGKEDMFLSQTLGCVMLDNREIDAVFEAAAVGTPVTIVGAMDVTNAVALALAGIERVGEEQGAEGADVQDVVQESAVEGS